MKSLSLKIALFMLFACSCFAENKITDIQKPLTIGVSYNQIMKNMEDYIPLMEKSTFRTGQPRYMGTTSDKTFTLDIVGDKNNVSNVSVMTAFPSDSLDVSFKNLIMLFIVLENVVPEWTQASEWVTSALDNINITGEPEDTIKGNKIIRLSTSSVYPEVTLYFLGIENINESKRLETLNIKEENAAKKEKKQKITFDQVTSKLGISFTRESNIISGKHSGKANYYHETNNGSKMIIQLIGAKDNISCIYISLFTSDDINALTENLIIISNIFKNVFPDWLAGKAWVLASLPEVTSVDKSNIIKTYRTGREIKLEYSEFPFPLFLISIE